MYTEHDPDDMDDYSGTTKSSRSPTTPGGSKSPKKLRYAVNDGRAMNSVHHPDDSKGGEGNGAGGGRKGSSEGGSNSSNAKNESKHAAGNAGNVTALGSLDTHSRGGISSPHNKAESKEQGKGDRRMSKKDQQAQGLFGSPGRQS